METILKLLVFFLMAFLLWQYSLAQKSGFLNIQSIDCEDIEVFTNVPQATHLCTMVLSHATARQIRELVFLVMKEHKYLAVSPTAYSTCSLMATPEQQYISSLPEFNGSLSYGEYERHFYLAISGRINFGTDSDTLVKFAMAYSWKGPFVNMIEMEETNDSLDEAAISRQQSMVNDLGVKKGKSSLNHWLVVVVIFFAVNFWGFVVFVILPVMFGMFVKEETRKTLRAQYLVEGSLGRSIMEVLIIVCNHANMVSSILSDFSGGKIPPCSQLMDSDYYTLYVVCTFLSLVCMVVVGLCVICLKGFGHLFRPQRLTILICFLSVNFQIAIYLYRMYLLNELLVTWPCFSLAIVAADFLKDVVDYKKNRLQIHQD